MTTPAQRLANIANAGLSTGPRSSSGKAASAQNATTHGLSLDAKTLVIAGEDPAVFDAFAAGVRARLQPADAIEDLLVERVLACAWRLRRVLRIEHEVFATYAVGTNFDVFEKVTAGHAYQHDSRDAETLGKLARHEGALERSLYRGLHELERMQAARAGREVPLPVAVDVDVHGVGVGGSDVA